MSGQDPDKAPIKMLHDRLLVEVDRESVSGVVRRHRDPRHRRHGRQAAHVVRVVARGPHARSVEIGDRVLFDPEDKAEVEVQGETYVVMRERDVHAVAAERLGDTESTGLYL